MAFLPWKKRREEKSAQDEHMEAVDRLQEGMTKEQDELTRQLRLLQAQVSAIRGRPYKPHRGREA